MLLRQCVTCALLSIGLMIAAPAMGQTRNNAQQSPLAQASKAVVDARVGLAKAQADVQRARDKVKQQLLTKPEWAPVVQEMTRAESAVAIAKRNAMNAAHSKPEYQAAIKQRDEADKVRQQAVAPAGSGDDTAKVSDAELASAESSYITAAMKMKSVEKQVMGDDAALADANARLEAAKAKMAQLDAEIDDSLKNDQNYQALQQQLASAQQALDSAEQSLKQQRESLSKNRASSPRPSYNTPGR
jgi:chromosome segregation ATPase